MAGVVDIRPIRLCRKKWMIWGLCFGRRGSAAPMSSRSFTTPKFECSSSQMGFKLCSAQLVWLVLEGPVESWHHGLSWLMAELLHSRGNPAMGFTYRICIYVCSVWGGAEPGRCSCPSRVVGWPWWCESTAEQLLRWIVQWGTGAGLVDRLSVAWFSAQRSCLEKDCPWISVFHAL